MAVWHCILVQDTLAAAYRWEIVKETSVRDEALHDEAAI